MIVIPVVRTTEGIDWQTLVGCNLIISFFSLCTSNEWIFPVFEALIVNSERITEPNDDSDRNHDSGQMGDSP